ncbi:MAG: hypothetical protein J0I14_03690 [Propionibacteriaceae bacterium]|jgi:hypothetical protein|nr:hypothetical protein [Propionibacteriaceae bacterium]
MTGRSAFLWAKDYALSALMWAATIAAPTDPELFASGSLAPVVVVPGSGENWRFLRPLITRVHEAGHPVRVLPELRYTRGSIEGGAALLLDHLERSDLTAVTLLAHSKGGLIGKLAMARDGDRRIDRMVALATPWIGSSRAELLPLRHLRGLRPGAPLIESLALQTAPNARITSIYASWDEHVPLGSELDGATNIVLPIEGHARITTHPTAIAAVLEALRAA